MRYDFGQTSLTSITSYPWRELLVQIPRMTSRIESHGSVKRRSASVQRGVRGMNRKRASLRRPENASETPPEHELTVAHDPNGSHTARARLIEPSRVACSLRRGRVKSPPQQSLSFQLIQAGIEGATRDRPIDRRVEMPRDVRRVRVIAELEDRQHHGLLEFAQYALAPQGMIWEEDASKCP
jgi:hypothetical protein